MHGRSGWASEGRLTGPVPNRYSNRRYEEWHFFDLWMQVAPAEGKVWAIRGLQRIKEVCPDLHLVGDDWLAKEMAKSGGIKPLLYLIVDLKYACKTFGVRFGSN